MKKQKPIPANLHDTNPPKYGGADQPLDFSDRPNTPNSALPQGENSTQPPQDLG